MKAVLLAGGLGTRLSEETSVRPKPMVEIGGRPILWHIMQYYAEYGYDEFAVALGYLGEYKALQNVLYRTIFEDRVPWVGTSTTSALVETYLTAPVSIDPASNDNCKSCEDGACALHNSASVLHHDRDFERIAEHTGLVVDELDA